MQSSHKGKNLIFLISQPRAGSTMLQKILGSHSEILTVSEPWLMLHPLYALKKKGYQAEYNARLAKQAFDSFFELFPHKEQVYLDAIANTYSSLYNQLLDQTENKYFLDKTPRYYNIIPELARTFPEASFIILLRNPIAVLCSIISTWIVTDSRRWHKLRNYKQDLLKAPQLILEGINLLQNHCHVIHYEKLLQEPNQELKLLCQYLKISFEPQIIGTDRTDSSQWHFGDKKNLYKTSRPNAKNINSWHSKLSSPQIWRLASEYLNFLGVETINKMGYSHGDLANYLDSYINYYRLVLGVTLSLENMLKDRTYNLSGRYRHQKLNTLSKLENKGIWNIFESLPAKLEQ